MDRQVEKLDRKVHEIFSRNNGSFKATLAEVVESVFKEEEKPTFKSRFPRRNTPPKEKSKELARIEREIEDWGD